MPTLTRTAVADAHAYSDGTFDAVNALLDLGHTSATPDSYVALRFNDIQVDRGSAVDGASFVMNMNAFPPVDVTYHAHLLSAINPAFPGDAAGLRSAARTTAKNDHVIVADAALGNRTWSIQAALQEQVNKETWVKGGSIVVILKGATSTTRRTIHRSLENSNASFAQVLTINFTPPQPFTGSGSAAAPAGQGSGTGSSANPAATGAGSATAPAPTASGTGTSDSPGVTAAGSGVAPGQTGSGQGTTENPDVTATGSANAPGETASGEGSTATEPPYIAEGQDYAPEGSVTGVGSSDAPTFTADGVIEAPEQVVAGTGRSSPPPPLPEGTLVASPQSELANAVARHMLSLLPPGRKPKEGGRAFYTVVAFSALLADADEAAIQMIRDWSPSQTQRPDLLALVGTARGVKRGVGEPFEAYRARVVNAADFWRLGGTVPGVVRALETAGYKVKVTELYKTDRLRWAEFSLTLYPDRAEFTADTWNDGLGFWNDGTPWDWGISSTEKGRILGIVGEMKAAHSKVASIFYQHGGPQDFWDDGLGAWEDETIWHGFEPVQIL